MIHLPHLETDITQACQLSCVACNHAVPLWRRVGPWSANPAQVEQDLTRLARFVHADAWGALGGEPTLNPHLVEILRVARRSGIADTIEVWSNGLRLRQQAEDFWAAFDVLVLSVYPEQHTPESLAWIAERCQQAGVRLAMKDERAAPNFRTLLEPMATDAAATAAKFRSCFFRGFSRVANYGRFFTCCVAAHLPFLLLGRPYGTDGIAIDATLTESALRAYLDRPDPLDTCEVCAGRDTAVPLTWRQVRDPYAWTAASRYGDRR